MGGSRRNFLMGSGAGVLALRCGGIAAISGYLISPAPAKAWVQVAMAAVSVISAFSKRGDGGLSAILGAMNQKLDLISSQLHQVHVAISDVMADIGNVKELLIERSDDNLVRPFIADIQGTLIDYEPFYRAFRYPEKMRTAENRKKLDLMQERVSRSATTLQAAAMPQMPLVAATVPIACGIELLLMQLRQADPAYIREIKYKYSNWINELLDPASVRSIFVYVNLYSSKLKQTWAELGKYEEVRLSGYDRELDSEIARVTEMCYITREIGPKYCSKQIEVGRREGPDMIRCVEYSRDPGPPTLLIDRFEFKRISPAGVPLDGFSYSREVRLPPVGPYAPTPQRNGIMSRRKLFGGYRIMSTRDPNALDPLSECASDTLDIAANNDDRKSRILNSAEAKRLERRRDEIAALLLEAETSRYKLAVTMNAVTALLETRNQLNV